MIRLLLILVISVPLLSQSLDQKIQSVLDGFNGEVAFYYRHLKTGNSLSFNGNDTMPTASLIKIPILLTLFDTISARPAFYQKQMVYDSTKANYGTGGQILGRFREAQPISVSHLVSLMITYSDNHASLWLQELAGGGEAINWWLAKKGFKVTRMNSRTAGRRPIWQRWGWGQTTAREMAELVIGIRQSKWHSRAVSEEIQRVLSQIYWRSYALSQIPPGVNTLSKQGAVSSSRSEVVLVNAPSGDYVFCIITNNQTDTSWGYDNAGFELIRMISRILWVHHEPDHPWTPPIDTRFQSLY